MYTAFLIVTFYGRLLQPYPMYDLASCQSLADYISTSPIISDAHCVAS